MINGNKEKLPDDTAKDVIFRFEVHLISGAHLRSVPSFAPIQFDRTVLLTKLL